MSIAQQIQEKLDAEYAEERQTRLEQTNRLRVLVAGAVQGDDVDQSEIVSLCKDLGITPEKFEAIQAACEARRDGLLAESHYQGALDELHESSAALEPSQEEIKVAQVQVDEAYKKLLDPEKLHMPYSIRYRLDLTAKDFAEFRRIESKLFEARDQFELRRIRHYRAAQRQGELKAAIDAGRNVRDVSCGLESPADFRWPE